MVLRCLRLEVLPLKVLALRRWTGGGEGRGCPEFIGTAGDLEAALAVVGGAESCGLTCRCVVAVCTTCTQKSSNVVVCLELLERLVM